MFRQLICVLKNTFLAVEKYHVKKIKTILYANIEWQTKNLSLKSFEYRRIFKALTLFWINSFYTNSISKSISVWIGQRFVEKVNFTFRSWIKKKLLFQKFLVHFRTPDAFQNSWCIPQILMHFTFRKFLVHFWNRLCISKNSHGSVSISLSSSRVKHWEISWPLASMVIAWTNLFEKKNIFKNSMEILFKALAGSQISDIFYTERQHRWQCWLLMLIANLTTMLVYFIIFDILSIEGSC